MTAFNFELARHNMIEQQIRPWEVLDQRVLDTLASVPREEFVPQRYRNLAFGDVAIPLGHGEVMLKPNVEGRILQALAVQPADHVLEVGTGSGYLTACLARLAASVVSVDIIPEFTEAARRKLKAHGLSNVVLHVGDASRGWGEHRYNAIAVTGSVATVAEVWPRSLSLGGRLFVVAGQPPVMEALLITRVGEQEWVRESLFDTELPPLRNAAPVKAFEF
jgi:protein-L-isoaspartate(D-aspartate) O-methyltransferase